VGGERGLATNHVRWAGQRGNHSSTTALSPTKPPSEPPTVALEKLLIKEVFLKNKM